MLIHVGTQKIETDRMILRPFQHSDDEAMLKNWVADEKIQSMYSEPVYTTKAKVIIDYLFKNISITKDSIIADIGSGTGILTRQLLEKCNKVYGVSLIWTCATLQRRNCKNLLDSHPLMAVLKTQIFLIIVSILLLLHRLFTGLTDKALEESVSVF